jgi:hypothetical protein
LKPNHQQGANMSQPFTADSVTAVLALQGIGIEASRAAIVAEALGAQVTGAGKACAFLPFEAEPSGYLRANAGTAP